MQQFVVNKCANCFCALWFYCYLFLLAPDPVQNLKTSPTLLHRQNHTFSISIEWTPPVQLPEKYELYLMFFNQKEHDINVSLPGNATEYSVVAQLTGHGYEVRLYGVTPGGFSKPSYQGFQFNAENIKEFSEMNGHSWASLAIVKFIIILSIVFIVISVIIATLYVWKIKRKRNSAFQVGSDSVGFS